MGYRTVRGGGTINHTRMRDAATVPYAVLAVMSSMWVITAVSVSSFLWSDLTTRYGNWAGISAAAAIWSTVVVGICFTFFPALAVWALCHGWKSAPTLVTTVGVWSALQIFFVFSNPASGVLGAAGILATVAVWLPSAQAYIATVQENQTS